MKKLHWTQRPENKERLKTMRKKSATRRGRSKAEVVLSKKVGKKAGPDRGQIYLRAVETAIAANEVLRLTNLLAHAVLMTMIGGGK